MNNSHHPTINSFPVSTWESALHVPILVLGVGNPLMGDDGIGIELVQRLKEKIDHRLVHFEDGGTQGMSLLPLIEDADSVIILDAVKTGRKPGSIVLKSKDELPGYFDRAVSPHQIGMKEILGAAQLCGTMPKSLHLLGVEAEQISFCSGMSNAVRLAIPLALERAEQLIRKEIEACSAANTGIFFC
jgi:hydrogenase maturation protease